MIVLSRRTLVGALAALPILRPALARAQATPTIGAAGVATVRGDAGQTGRMPGPGPAGTPTLLWHAADLVGRGFAPVAAGDLVFAMAEEPEDALVALDAASGAERWRVGRRRGASLMLPAMPTVADDVVYVSGHEDEAERRSVLLALDTTTGQERWRIPLATGEMFDEWLCPLAADGVVYAAATDGNAFAFDAANGQERWRVAVGNASFQPPALADSLLVFIHEDGLLALDAVTGQERWRDGPLRTTFTAVDGGLVYAMAEGFGLGLTLHALDAATGEERWTFEGDSGLTYGAPAIADGTVYVSHNFQVTALDAATGAVKWQLDGIDAQAQAIVDEIVYATGYENVSALNAATGAEVWAARDWGLAIEEASALGGPSIMGGRIFLYAMDQTGRRLLAALGDAAGETATPVS